MLETLERDQSTVEAAPLTAAEKRDARRAAKALEKLQAEDVAAVGVSVTINADDMPKLTEALGGVIKPAASATQLLAFVERVENINREIADRIEDRKEIFAEAKGLGFDVPTLRKIVSLRAMDEDKRLETEALLATYMHAVGLAVQTEMKF
jgi:uncharacterized protein (UPF0335 family)